MAVCVCMCEWKSPHHKTPLRLPMSSLWRAMTIKQLFATEATERKKKERMKGAGRKKSKRELQECKWVSLCAKTPPEGHAVGSHTHLEARTRQLCTFAGRSASWLCSAAQILQDIPTFSPLAKFLKEAKRKKPCRLPKACNEADCRLGCGSPLTSSSAISSGAPPVSVAAW